MINKINIKRQFQIITKLIHLISAISVSGGFLAMLCMLLSKDMNLFNRNEIVVDKMILFIFNSLIIYGAIGMVITVFLYSFFTEWGFFQYRFLIIKWICLVAIFAIAWFVVGSAISGMTSISDAGLHLKNMGDQYQEYYKQSVIGIITELVLLIVTMYVSIRKPFGKRDVKPFK